MLGASLPDQKINQLIWRVFTQKHGLTLQADTVTFLKEKMSMSSNALSEESLVSALQFIAAAYKKQSQRPSLVDVESLAKLMEGLLKAPMGHGSTLAPARQFIHALSFWDLPRWDYDPHQKKFIKNTSHLSLLGDAEARARAFRRHYETLKQRIMRNPEMGMKNKLFTIKSVKGIKGTESRCLFGMLTCMVEGELYLEDCDDFIKLDLSQCQVVVPSFYTEYSFVIVMGVSRGDVFEVNFISAPPMEKRSESMASSAAPDFTHGLAVADVIRQNREVETSYKNTSVVFINELWLDSSRIMVKFDAMLAGFNSLPSKPAAFIISGDFLSSKSNSLSSLKNGFDGLATLIAKYSGIVNESKFIFVPSTQDLLATKTLPRPALPDDLLQAFISMGIDAQMMTNPCRLFVFTKELVFFREDLTVKFKKNLLDIPALKESGEEASTMRSILDQSHLNPFSSQISPSHWDYDHCLEVYPTPDILIVAEKSTAATSREEDCLCVNPGSFATSEYSFAMVYPLLSRCELCKV